MLFNEFTNNNCIQNFIKCVEVVKNRVNKNKKYIRNSKFSIDEYVLCLSDICSSGIP